MLSILTVHIIICDEVILEVGAGVTVKLVEGTEAVVLIDHVVDLQLWRPSLPDVLAVLVGIAFVVVRTYEVRHGIVLHGFGVAEAPCPEGCCDVEATCTIVDIEVVGQGLIILIHTHEVLLEA